jgi:hypothetical protein
LEVWLLGYQVEDVKRLGDQTLLNVAPAAGFQVIRFPGHEGPLQVHVASGGTEIITLPLPRQAPGQPDCSR